MIAAGDKFTDNEFQPNIGSLLNPEINYGGMEQDKIQEYGEYIWVRASDLFPRERLKIFNKPIKPDNI